MFISKIHIPKQLNERKIRTEISKFVLLFIVLFSTISCQKRDWDNPFDPDCPKESFTPSNFQAEQQGNVVVLSWIQANTNISGFKIERKIENSSWLEVASLEKSISTWNDNSISGGKLHEYRLYALAGSNQSNKVTTQITPTFSATIVTIIATNITSKTALCGGKITNDGGASVSSRGVCWNTTGNPTIEDSKTTDGSGNGDFTSNMTNLATNTAYHVRAYALNNAGIAYGNEIIFTTFYGEVTDIDGNVYLTIKIGNQVWMAENLKVTKYNDGTPIPNITDISNWAGLTSGAYCFYNNDISNKNIYGALYNWYAVYTNNLAPSGWHVPTDEEWTTLSTYLGGEGIAGGKLKEIGTAHWASPNSLATNETRFTGLPGGHVSQSGFVFLGTYGYWWSWTDGNTQAPLFRALNFNNGGITTYAFDQKVGLSVRCIQGVLTKPVLSTTFISQITNTTAMGGGNISSDGGAPIINRGVCWNTSGNPTISDAKTSDGTGSGNFSSQLNQLSPNTTYYVRAYATNSMGTAYGTELSFPTSPVIPQTVTDIDGNVYKTVTIGTQVWMAENLKVTRYNSPLLASMQSSLQPLINADAGSLTLAQVQTAGYISSATRTSITNVLLGIGLSMAEISSLNITQIMALNDSIPNVTENTIWASTAKGAFCWYDNNVGNKSAYGALYNWAAVNSGNLCPTGWHVPSDAEWKKLEMNLGMTQEQVDATELRGTTQGTLMKTTSGWDYDGNGTNYSGFSGLPGGSRYNNGTFSNLKSTGWWWSCTEISSTSAWYRHLMSGFTGVYRAGNFKNLGFSVRCLRD